MDVHAPQWGLVEKAMAAAILALLSPTLGQWVPRVETLFPSLFGTIIQRSRVQTTGSAKVFGRNNQLPS